MVLDVANLDIKPGLEPEFEKAFDVAQKIISSMPGYVSHELQRCLENSSRYILLVNWAMLKDHTVGFRGLPQYQDWSALLHDFYDPFPQVLHFESVFSNRR